MRQQTKIHIINFLNVSAAVAVGAIVAILICWQIISLSWRYADQRNAQRILDTERSARYSEVDHQARVFMQQFEAELDNLK